MAVQVRLLPDTLAGKKGTVPFAAWPVRLLARSPAFQAGQMGSKPIRATWRRTLPPLAIPGSSNGRTTDSEPVDAGSTPAPGTADCPGGETDIMAPSEGAGPGSIPGR